MLPSNPNITNNLLRADVVLPPEQPDDSLEDANDMMPHYELHMQVSTAYVLTTLKTS